MTRRQPALRGLGGTFSGADLLMLGAVLVWSLNVVVVKVALRDAPPMLWATLRFLVGGVVLLVAVRVVGGGRHRPARDDLRLIAAAAVLGIAANQAAFTFALRFTSAADVSLIVGSTPLMVAAYAALRSRERIGARVWAGLLVGAAGLALVVGTGSRGNGSLGGDLLAVAAPAVWAAYVGLLGGLLQRQPTLWLSAVVTMAGTLALAPFGAAEAAITPPHWSWTLVGLLGFSGVLAVGFCNVAAFVAIGRLGGTRASAYTYLQPFIGAVFAALLLGDSLRPLQLVGGGVVLAGVLTGRPARPRALAGAEHPRPKGSATSPLR